MTQILSAPYAPVSVHHPETLPGRLAESDSVSIDCYEHQIPPFVSNELVRLYGNFYASLPRLRMLGKLNNASTYAVRKGGELITLFLFRIERGRLEVLNEVIRIEEDEISRFATFVFAAFRSVHVISFRAVELGVCRLGFVHQQYNYLEDIVVNLPGSSDDYLASLGKNTRRNMRRYLKLVNQNFSSYQFETFIDDAINESQVKEIIAFNTARMLAKNKIPSVSDLDAERMIKMARAGGMVCIVRIDDRICAGSVSYRVGNNYFVNALAHDEQYNFYSLGVLCCYLTICEAITRGGKEFHFSWGRYPYKYIFLGVQRDLDFLAIYRSPQQLFLNADLAFKVWLTARLRLTKLWLHELVQKETRSGKMAVKFLSFARSLRELKASILRKFDRV
ncbi:MAG: GNAT family N-acetyltransferase [Pseudomonadota bacterium]